MLRRGTDTVFDKHTVFLLAVQGLPMKYLLDTHISIIDTITEFHNNIWHRLMGYSATMYQSGIPQICESLLRMFECSKAQRQCAQSWISCINYWCERVNVSIQCSCFSEIGNSVRFLKPRRQRESSLELELENKKKKNIESEMEEGTFALGDVNNAIKLVFLIRISVRKCIVRKLEILKVKKN